jgi:hypothetical protein
MKISHNKLRNTGILFELLVRTITSDTLAGKDSPAVGIIKKHFVKTELSKEYKLYETLFNKTQLTEGKAEMILNVLLESSKKLNKSKLNKEKYALIKEIKECYNLEEFFKTKLANYKYHAAFYNLMEMYSKDINSPREIIANKITIFEHLTSKPNKIEENSLMNEYSNLDRDLRMLSYKIMSEKFNEKYSDFNDNQKEILREYINSVDNSSKLREFYNKKLNEIKIHLSEVNKKTKNEASRIKVEAIVESMSEVKKNDNIKNEDITDLLQHCDLLEELKTVNKV